jgi:hypothetical protein
LLRWARVAYAAGPESSTRASSSRPFWLSQFVTIDLTVPGQALHPVGLAADGPQQVAQGIGIRNRMGGIRQVRQEGVKPGEARAASWKAASMAGSSGAA